MRRAATILVLSFGCATHQGVARSDPGAAISGIVLDQNGAPIKDAEVVAVTPGGRRIEATTKDDGRYAFFKLPQGYYDLVAQKDGYQAAGATNQLVQDGIELTVQLQLRSHRAPDHPNIVRPLFVSGPSPQYTKEARDHRAEGTVVAKCIIGVEGRVRNCQILQSVQYMDEAVLIALLARQYQPATLDGKPIEVDYTFKIKVSLPLP